MNVRDYFKQHKELLDLYTNAITKAHGAHHPEVFEVRSIYQAIEQKINDNNWDLDREVAQLETTTHSFAIPKDVCQTFEKTYQTLSEFCHLYKIK